MGNDIPDLLKVLAGYCVRRESDGDWLWEFEEIGEEYCRVEAT